MSLKEIVKHRIMKDMIQRVRASILNQFQEDNPYIATNPKNKYCAFLVDAVSLRILSAACKTYDILDEGVSVVESVFKKRQPLPEMDAIYFISPEPRSIDAMCEDFSNEKQPQYRSAHVFLTAPMHSNPELLEPIAKCTGLLARLRSFVEFNLSFIAFERRVFHFDLPSPISSLFPSAAPELLDHTADQLLTVCMTFGDWPNIRFHSNSFGINEKVATLLHQKLQNVQVQGLSRGRTNLLILDRSIDLAPLFVHEYTYQAYIYDMLNVSLATPLSESSDTEPASGGDPDNTVVYPTVTKDGRQESTVALLGEHDDVYLRYRHQHLMVALKRVPEEIKRFLSDNAAAKFRKRKQDMTNEELQRTIHDLPEYQEMLAKYTLHHSITQRCFLEFNQHSLNRVGLLEQNLATGVDSNGKEVSARRCLSSLGTLLCDSSIGSEEKVRLLSLYFSMIDNVKDDDRRKMIEAAQLPLECSSSLRAFFHWGIHKADGGADVEGSSAHSHRLLRDVERMAYFASRAKSSDIALSRFQPVVRHILEQLVQGTLHRGRFPYMVEPGSGASTVAAAAAGAGGSKHSAVHVRARDRDWGFESVNVERDTIQPGERGADPYGSPPRGETSKAVILFILGGACLSEMRAAYEVSKQLGCEVYIGGSTLLTPKKVLNDFKSLAFRENT